jgi:alkylation response protein AidB-like acyl-CoA dehydrogenase
MTISRDRWQFHLKTHGQFYHEMARQLEDLHVKNNQLGAQTAAYGLRALAETLETARLQRLTRHQHILFKLGELIAHAEGAASLVRKAARAKEGTLNVKTHGRFNADALAVMARIAARDAASRILGESARWIGSLVPETVAADLEKKSFIPQIHRAQAGLLEDMDYVADVLYERS